MTCSDLKIKSGSRGFPTLGLANLVLLEKDDKHNIKWRYLFLGRKSWILYNILYIIFYSGTKKATEIPFFSKIPKSSSVHKEDCKKVIDKIEFKSKCLVSEVSFAKENNNGKANILKKCSLTDSEDTLLIFILLYKICPPFWYSYRRTLSAKIRISGIFHFFVPMHILVNIPHFKINLLLHFRNVEGREYGIYSVWTSWVSHYTAGTCWYWVAVNRIHVGTG